jgi:hypothetical protein
VLSLINQGECSTPPEHNEKVAAKNRIIANERRQNHEHLSSTALEINPQLHHRDGERIFGGFSDPGRNFFTKDICAN